MNESATLLDRWKLVKAASVDPRLSRGDVAVLIAILDRMNSDGVAWPSLGTVAADAHVDRRTATRAIARLVDTSYLLRESGNRTASNRYRVGPAGRDNLAPTGRGEFTPTGRGSHAPKVGAAVSHGVGAALPPELASLNLPIEPTHIAADAADASRPADPIWGLGLQFLIRKGMKEQAARTFLGKLKAMVGDTTAAILLGQAEAQDITDPRAWLMKAARGGAGKGRPVGAIPRDERDENEIAAENLAQLARFGLEVTP